LAEKNGKAFFDAIDLVETSKTRKGKKCMPLTVLNIIRYKIIPFKHAKMVWRWNVT
jgi:hypothetical protein